MVGTSTGYLTTGSLNDATQTPHPRIWGSADGTGWAELGVEGSGGVGMVDQITVNGGGQWAATGTLDDEVVIWRSDDGRDWALAAVIGDQPGPFTFSPGIRLIGLPNGFIAVAPLPAGTAAGGDPVSDGEVIEFASGIARQGDTVVIAGDIDISGAESGRLGWFSWVGTIEP